MILSGGGHEKFARLSGIKYEENTLYKDNASPIMMDIETRKRETERYYKEISLEEIRKNSKRSRLVVCHESYECFCTSSSRGNRCKIYYTNRYCNGIWNFR